MRRPRDVSGREVAKALEQFGYAVTRQTGSHMRLTTEEGGQHHVTIPAHKRLTIGKINAILWELVSHFGLPRKELLRRLFG